MYAIFLAASKFDNGAFIDVLSDLNENQFIQKPIQNEDLIKIITMKMEEKPSVGFEER